MRARSQSRTSNRSVLMPKRKVSALLCTTLRCGDALSCKVIASPPLAGLLHARHAVYMEGARHEAGGSRGRGHLLGSLAARQHASRCLSRRWLHGPQSVTVLLAAYRRQAGAACDDIWFERPKTSACVRASVHARGAENAAAWRVPADIAARKCMSSMGAMSRSASRVPITRHISLR